MAGRPRKEQTEQKTKRPINKALTKQMLVDMGITQVYWDVENQEWWIDRCWRIHNRGPVKHTKKKIYENIVHHPYSNDKSYPIVAFGYNNKTYTYPLSRFLYAWFKGDIPEGMVVDHIDNNPFNNSLDNLQLLTVEENLNKRYQDCENPHWNHYQIINERKEG